MAGQEIENKSLAIKHDVDMFEIATQDDARDAVTKRVGIIKLIKEIEGHHKPMKAKAWQAHKEIVDKEKSLLAPLRSALSVLDGKVLTYRRNEQERQRQITARVQALAIEKANEQKQQALDEAAKATDPEQKRHWEEVAEAVPMEAAEMVPEEPTPGLGTRETWRARVDDKEAMVRWAVANDRFDLLIPNEAKLNEMARQVRSNNSPVDGVAFVQKTTLRQK